MQPLTAASHALGAGTNTARAFVAATISHNAYIYFIICLGHTCKQCWRSQLIVLVLSCSVQCNNESGWDAPGAIITP